MALVVFLDKELFSLTRSPQAQNLPFRLFLHVGGELAALSLNIHVFLHVAIIPGFIEITPVDL